MSSVEISYDNTWATVSGDANAKDTVKTFLTYRVEGFQFTKAHKKHRWDGYKTLYQWAQSRFPAGLVPLVRDHLAGQGWTIHVRDKRERPEPSNDYGPGPDLVLPNRGSLQPHQDEAVTRILQATRGVVHHPVGAGKSIVIVEAVRRLGLPSLVLVGRKELLRQQYDAFVNCVPDFARNVGIMGDGIDTASYWTVGTVQTITRRLSRIETWEETVEWLKQFSAVFIDECHHLPANSYDLLLRAMPNAYYRVGLSASPFSDGQKERELSVIGLTGPVISEYNAVEGIEFERLVPADIYLVDPGNYVLRDGGKPTYPKEIEYGIVKNDTRNDLVVRLAGLMGKLGPTIVLTERIEHGRNLRALMLDEGYEEVK